MVDDVPTGGEDVDSCHVVRDVHIAGWDEEKEVEEVYKDGGYGEFQDHVLEGRGWGGEIV